MANLLKQLNDYKLIEKWIPVLDWILSDEKFSEKKNWEPSKVSKFTKEVKKIDSNLEIKILCAKDPEWDKQDNLKTFIRMNHGDSVGKDIVRHIRNGIAHGQTKILNDSKYGKCLMIEIKDFKKDGNIQTAHFMMPLEYIVTIHEKYKMIEKLDIKKKKKKSIPHKKAM